MARLARIAIPDQPLHIIHRGNNRQDVFITDEDMFRIKDDIAQSLSARVLKHKIPQHSVNINIQ